MDTQRFARPTAEICARAYDLIVVGGGITGAGIAQDAASRGLKVILVDKGDFASGTSSKSTKLIHGGLRYLENLQFAVTLESVRERQVQQRLAPHMVWSVPFVIPKYRTKRLKNLKLGAGLWLYDLMATGFANTRLHKSVCRDEVLDLCPGINADGLTGAFIYYDCRTDDARHTLAVARSAVDQGAVALNYTKVVGFLRGNGGVVGITVEDVLKPGTTYAIRGALTVNATGVWTRRTTDLAHLDSRTEVVPAKGIHITLAKDRLPLKAAMIVPSVRDKRFCFAIPWYNSIVVGTTDTEYKGDFDKIEVTADEVRYCIDALNAQFPSARITEGDVTGTYAGLRPLIRDAGSTSTADISREHKLEQTAPGLISIAGGKLTTYRRMARSTVDMALKSMAAQGTPVSAGPCITDKLMLGGWERHDDTFGITNGYRHMALDLGLGEDTASYLPTAYGRDVVEVLTMVRREPRLAARLAPGHPYIAAQVLYAIEAEGARTVEDILARRVRLAITDKKAALAASVAVADLMQAELGWSAADKAAQLEDFRRNWVQ